MEPGSRLLDDEIRILHLLPSIDVDSEIQCTLTREKAEPRTYVALSYVWGDPTPAQPILLNGTTAYVTPNLSAALRQFRQSRRVLRLWVDALCINQNDHVEKSAVVRRMGEIYKNSKQVWMWLGVADCDSDLAMRWIEDIGSMADSEEWASALDLLFNDLSFIRPWIALHALFRRQYWKRLWVVQEMLGSRNPTVICGSLRADWLKFAIVLRRLMASPARRGASYGMLHDSGLLKYLIIRQADLLYKWRIYGKLSIPFLEGLIMCRNLDATDSRDHIYGILSLVDHGDFEPDYTKSCFDLYRDVVKHLVKKDKSLDILTACSLRNLEPLQHMKNLASQHDYRTRHPILSRDLKHLERRCASGLSVQTKYDINEAPRKTKLVALRKIELAGRESDDSLPSWAPNWNHKATEGSYLLLNKSHKCHYRAAGNTTPIVNFCLKDELTMQVYGIRVDTIQSISHSNLNSTWDGVRKGPSEEWELWCKHNDNSQMYGDSRDRKEAFVQTMVAGRNHNGERATYDLQAAWTAVKWGPERMLATGAPSPIQLQMSDLDQRYDELTWTSFCITNKSYIGRIPRYSEVGDLIVIFLGSKVPTVLRKYPDRDMYYHVGECYIHGIMEGELMGPVEEGKVVPEEFILL
ncbi:Heterokaryon incompatibility protein [Rutstroemia sp. NJR-2017a WRK4]|nr:Heterokaryon incompatibility protein [Rutstroemia sp. NJR-2017a WRK4]